MSIGVSVSSVKKQGRQFKKSWREKARDSAKMMWPLWSGWPNGGADWLTGQSVTLDILEWFAPQIADFMQLLLIKTDQQRKPADLNLDFPPNYMAFKMITILFLNKAGTLDIIGHTAQCSGHCIYRRGLPKKLLKHFN